MSRPLFENLHEIAVRVSSAEKILLFLDFDGTLAPIVEHPDLAHLPPAVHQTLRRLAQREDLDITIISGRSCADVQARIGIAGLIYAGNHGMEIVGPDVRFVEPTAAATQEEMQCIAQRLAKRLGHIAGALVESKGLTTSVHYRNTMLTRREELAQVVTAAVADQRGLFTLTAGKMVYEIRPRVNWHKGHAARWINDKRAQPNALSICLGDDRTDEDMFVAMPEAVSIKVGAATDSAAHYHIADPQEAHVFLSWLEEVKISKRSEQQS